MKARAFFYALCLVLAGTGMLVLCGFRFNITDSYPEGLYLKTNNALEKGALVILCPEDTDLMRLARQRGYIESGFCPGGHGYMIKKIVATGADKVRITKHGVFINGSLLPNSTPKTSDKSGRPLPQVKGGELTLDDNSVLLMSDYSPNSFDGRYFGITAKKQIISTIRPVWTR